MKEVNESQDILIENNEDEIRTDSKKDDYDFPLVDNKNKVPENEKKEEKKPEEDIVDEEEELLYANSKVAVEKAYNFLLKNDYHNKKRMNSYSGEKYTEDVLRNNTSVLSLDRTGGHSTSFLALLSMKDEKGNHLYSFDDLWNPKKLNKEKQEMFDKVVTNSNKAGNATTCDDPNNESSRWLVKTLYEGLKEGVKLMDELAEEVDYSDDNFPYSEAFIKLTIVGHLVFDGWQEICRFKSLKNEYVREDHPEFTDDECYEHLVELTGPLGNMYENIKSIATTHQYFQENKKYDNHGTSEYLKGALLQTYIKDIFIDWKNSGVEKLSDYFRQDDTCFKYAQIQMTAGDALFDIAAETSTGTNKYDGVVDKRIAEGSLFKNVNIVPGGRNGQSVIDNVPTLGWKDFDIPGSRNRKRLSPEALRKEQEKKRAKFAKQGINKALSDDIGAAMLSHNFENPEINKAIIIDNKENESRIQWARDEQLTTEDMFMLGVMYQARNTQINKLKDNNIEPVTAENIINNTKEIQDEYRDIVTDRINTHTLDELSKSLERLTLATAKSLILTGKTYKTISEGLGDQELKHEKTVALMTKIGGMDVYEAEKALHEEVVNSEELAGDFANLLNYNSFMTYAEVYAKLGFTEEEMLERKSMEELSHRFSETMDNNAPEDEIDEAANEFFYKEFLEMHQKRAMNRIKASLSLGEQKLLEYGQSAAQKYEDNKNNIDAQAEEIERWQAEEYGDELNTLEAKFRKDQYNTFNAVIYGRKTVGLNEKDEMRGAYREILVKKDGYVKAFVKGDPQATQKADAVLNDTMAVTRYAKKTDKLSVSFASYIKLHTGVRMGKTPEELVDNYAKCVAALYLQQNDKDFSIKSIHKNAEIFKEMYSLNALKNHPEKLADMLTNADSVLKSNNALIEEIYGVKPDKIDKYLDDMSILAQSLTTTQGHGKQYSRLYKLINNVAELKNKGLSKEQLADEIKAMNAPIYDAAVEYIKSKGFGKMNVENNPRAVAAFSAISILTKATGGLDYRTTKLVTDINREMNRKNNIEAGNFDSMEIFKNRFGAHSVDNMTNVIRENPNREVKNVIKK